MGNRKRRKLAESLKTKVTKKKYATCQGDEATQILRDKVFSISLVTDCIFNHIPFYDLVPSCSLVSKNWDSAVKEYLRRRRTCLFKCNMDDFNELEHRLQILKKPGRNNCHPFSGIILCIFPKSAELKQRQSSSRKSILRELFSLIQPTHTVLELKDYDSNVGFFRPPRLHLTFKSDVDILISNVLFRLLPAYEIKHLSFNVELNGFTYDWKLWLKNVGRGGFATLETIQPITCYGTLEDYTALLRACPNLKGMPFKVPGEALETFDKYNKLPLVKHLIVNNFRTDYCGKIFERGTENFNMLTKINDFLVTIRLNRCYGWAPEEYQWLGRIIQLHSKSLEKIELFYYAPVVASHYENVFQLNFPPLPFVKKVDVYYWSRILSSQDNDFNFVNHPHLKRIFPNARIFPTGENNTARSMFELTCYTKQ